MDEAQWAFEEARWLAEAKVKGAAQVIFDKAWFDYHALEQAVDDLMKSRKAAEEALALAKGSLDAAERFGILVAKVLASPQATIFAAKNLEKLGRKR